MKIEFYAKSDIGLVRKRNEDSFSISEMLNLFIVADGMGGYDYGKDASLTVVNAIKSYIEEKCFSNKSVNEEIIKEAINTANNAVQKKLREYRQKNPATKMGSTLVLLVIKNDKCILVNIGDSRIYLLRNNVLYQKTKDHSFIQEQTDNNIELPEAIKNSYKNAITRAIGIYDNVQPDFYYVEPKENDLFLLSTDGLHSLITNHEIEEILNTSLSLQDASERLIEKAKEKGGNDNITVCLVKIKEIPQKKTENKTVSITASTNEADTTILTKEDIIIITVLLIFLILTAGFYYIMIFKF